MNIPSILLAGHPPELIDEAVRECRTRGWLTCHAEGLVEALQMVENDKPSVVVVPLEFERALLRDFRMMARRSHGVERRVLIVWDCVAAEPMQSRLAEHPGTDEYVARARGVHGLCDAIARWLQVLDQSRRRLQPHALDSVPRRRRSDWLNGTDG